MLKRNMLGLGVLALAAQMTVSEARADNWFDFGFLWRPHRARDYYADPYYMPSRPRTNLYGDPNAAPFDDTYYNPTVDGQPGGPPPIPHKPVKHKVVKAKPAVSTPATASATTATTAAASKTAAVQNAQTTQTVGEVDASATPATGASDTAVTTDSTTKSLTTASSTTKMAAASGGISCDKAQQVVAGYGFSSVKPATCSGKVYAFNAVRDGKPYAIKLNSATGELTEVKKAQP